MPSASQTRSGKPSKPAVPISAHPAFPLVVALWFAALLGLGSLVLPDALLNALGRAISGIVPAAAPPLGFKARALIALAFGVLGAGMGYFAARKIAQPAHGETRRRSFASQDPAQRQPLSAREELGSDSFDSVTGFASARRRALASVEEVRKSDFLVVAPLPGQQHEQGYTYADGAAPEPLDLSECAEFTEEQVSPVQDTPMEDNAMIHRHAFGAPPSPAETGEPLPFSPPSMVRRTPVRGPFDEPEKIELAVFEEDQGAPEPAPAPEFAPEPEFAPAPFAAPQFQPEEQEAPVAEVVEVPEDSPETHHEPNLFALVQKLGATLEKHREWSAQRSQAAVSAPQFPRPVLAAEAPASELASDFAPDFDMAAPDEAAQAIAAFFAPEPTEDAEHAPAAAQPESQPAAGSQLRPFAGLGRITDLPEDSDEDHEIHSLAASFSLPLGRAAQPVEPAFAEPALKPEAPEAEEGYSSLLAVKNPFRNKAPEFVRVEEPEPESLAPQPAVIFPHEAPQAAGEGVRAFDRPGAGGPPPVARFPTQVHPAAASEDHDRVLREALLNLQRINKH